MDVDRYANLQKLQLSIVCTMLIAFVRLINSFFKENWLIYVRTWRFVFQEFIVGIASWGYVPYDLYR